MPEKGSLKARQVRMHQEGLYGTSIFVGVPDTGIRLQRENSNETCKKYIELLVSIGRSSPSNNVATAVLITGRSRRPRAEKAPFGFDFTAPFLYFIFTVESQVCKQHTAVHGIPS